MSKKRATAKKTNCSSTKRKQSVLFIADLDSQIFGSLPFANKFRERGWEVIYCIPNPNLLPSSLKNRLKEDFPIISLSLRKIPTSEMIKRFTTIGVFLAGSNLARLRRDIYNEFKNSNARPILFNGFNGLVYEKFEEGIAWRLGYDIICLNSPNDFKLFDNFISNSPYADQKIALTGINRNIRQELETKPRNKTSKRTLIFAEQTVVPKSIEERLYLIELLNGLALANPQWNIIIKLRIREGEKTFHKETLSFERCMRNSASNIRISHIALNELLDEASMLCAISSTAIFDALSRNIPVFVISDFGIRTNIGTHLFLSSNIDISIADQPSLDDVMKLKPSKTWLNNMGLGDEFSVDTLVDMIESDVIQTDQFPLSPYDNRFFPTPKNIKVRRQELKTITAFYQTEGFVKRFFNIFRRRRN